MLDRILSPKTSNTNREDCLSCRIVGGAGLSFLAIYILNKTYQRRHQMNKWTTIGSASLGSFILSIGGLRLLGINFKQFNNNTDNNNKHENNN
jgi:hypothetical protein